MRLRVQVRQLFKILDDNLYLKEENVKLTTDQFMLVIEIGRFYISMYVGKCEPGQITVPIKKVRDFLNELGEDEIIACIDIAQDGTCKLISSF